MEGGNVQGVIREELAVYSENMSWDMRKKFGFVNIAGNAFQDIDVEAVDTVG